MTELTSGETRVIQACVERARDALEKQPPLQFASDEMMALHGALISMVVPAARYVFANEAFGFFAGVAHVDRDCGLLPANQRAAVDYLLGEVRRAVGDRESLPLGAMLQDATFSPSAVLELGYQLFYVLDARVAASAELAKLAKCARPARS